MPYTMFGQQNWPDPIHSDKAAPARDEKAVPVKDRKAALDAFAFSVRRLSDSQKAEICEAVDVLIKAVGQERFNSGWNQGISARYAKAAPASAPVMPAPIVSVPPANVTVNFPKDAIQIRNVLPADLRVTVQSEPTETRLIRDESGNISGAVTS